MGTFCSWASWDYPDFRGWLFFILWKSSVQHSEAGFRNWGLHDFPQSFMENAGIGLQTRLSLLPSTSFPILVVTVRRSIWRCLVVNPRIKKRTQWKVKTTWGKHGEWNWCFSVGKCLFLSTVASPRKMCGEGVLFRHTVYFPAHDLLFSEQCASMKVRKLERRILCWAGPWG